MSYIGLQEFHRNLAHLFDALGFVETRCGSIYCHSFMIPFLAFAILLVIPACAGRGPESLSRIEVLERSSSRIEVDNQHFSDATIYALEGRHRVRLGSVTGKDSKIFNFRWPIERLRIQVHFTSGQTFTSDELIVYPGVDDNLFLTIGSGSRSRLFLGRRGGH